MKVLKILNLFWAFILTKWYVNSVIAICIRFLASSFILTKWYVNHFADIVL
ncbi:hypothetical protein ACTPEW_17470 [Clostridioides difficile]